MLSCRPARTVAEGKIEEERRLFYVGMTRARSRLILTYPALKEFHKKSITVTPCRFIREIPDTCKDVDFSKHQTEQKQEYIENFFETMRRQFAAQGLTEDTGTQK